MQEKMKSIFPVHCSRFGITPFLSGTSVNSTGGPFDMAAVSSSTAVLDLTNIGIVTERLWYRNCSAGRRSDRRLRYQWSSTQQRSVIANVRRRVFFVVYASDWTVDNPTVERYRLDAIRRTRMSCLEQAAQFARVPESHLRTPAVMRKRHRTAAAFQSVTYGPTIV